MSTNLKQEVRIETDMRFGRNTPYLAEVNDAARQVLESKLKRKWLSLDSIAREEFISAICDYLLAYWPLTLSIE